MRSAITILVLFFFAQGLNAQYHDTIALNELRILASHNSYKKLPDPKVLEFLDKHKKKLGEANDPKQIEYEHETLTCQLDSFNIRGFELDVNYDPKGGRYYKRRINGFIKGLRKKSHISELREPGFKIIHITDVDYETNYLTLKSTLKELNEWSNAHPNHIPLFVNVEAKGDGIGDYSKLAKFVGFKTAILFDSIAFGELDKEIHESIDSNNLFVPNDLKQEFSSINERLNTHGWPMLNECTGKIIFILQGSNSHLYTAFLDAGQDRPMFVYGRPGGKSTAFVLRNQPIGNTEEIEGLAKQYIVRTRSDAGTLEARANDSTRFIVALSSKAQIVSADYYRPNHEFSEFFVKIPDELQINMQSSYSDKLKKALANLKEDSSLISQSHYFDLFPNSFVSFEKTFGYRNDAPAPLYDGYEFIVSFFELDEISKEEQIKKWIGIALGGRYDADAVAYFQFYLQMEVLKNVDLCYDLLRMRSNEEIESFFHFFFDGIHPRYDFIPKELEALKEKDGEFYGLITKAHVRVMEHSGH